MLYELQEADFDESSRVNGVPKPMSAVEPDDIREGHEGTKRNLSPKREIDVDRYPLQGLIAILRAGIVERNQ